MSTALVLFMTIPGLSLFYGGLVRSNGVLSVLMQCFAITCVVSLIWVAVGYSLAFGSAGVVLGDFSRVFFHGMGPESVEGTVPEASFAIFQLTFAIITPALIVGGFAERMRFFRRAPVRCPVVASRLRPRGAFGVGRRLAWQDGAFGLRRRDGRAYHRRRECAGRGPSSSVRAAPSPTNSSRRTT